MKTNKKTAIKSIITIILLITSLFTGITKNNLKVDIAAADNSPYITITSANHQETASSKVYFKADTTSNLVTITINAYNVGSSDITIKYYAEDGTAICMAGDYYQRTSSVTSSSKSEEKLAATHELTTIIFNSTKTTATITYDTTKAPVGTSISSKTISDKIYRYFTFKIAEIAGGTIKDSQSSFVCVCNNTKTAVCDSDSNGYYYRGFNTTWKKEYKFGEWDNGDGDQTGRFNLLYDIKDNNVTTLSRQDALSNLIDTGLGKLYTEMYIWADAHIKNWDALVFNTYADNSGATDDKDYKIGYWYEDHVWDDEHYSDVVISNKYDHYAILDPKWGDAVRVVGHNECDTYNRWATLTYTSVISDDIMPYVTGSYVDASSMLVDGTLRIMIRFNEPIQSSNATNLSVIGQVNSKKDIKFSYEAGNYTDTLVFVTNLKDSGLDTYNNYITKIDITEIENLDTICDFGHNIKTKKNNFLDDYDYDDIIGDYETAKCDIDLRLPEISSVTSNNPYDATQSRTVQLKLANLSKATLYYSWSTDINKKFDSVKDYDSSMEVIGDTSSIATKTISLSNVTGEYYLHVCIKNIFGRESTFVIGSAGKITSGTGHGYRLDNTTPTINNVTTYNESLTSKIFNIQVDDGDAYENGGIQTVYISIKTDLGSTLYSNYPIYSTDSDVSKTINSDILIGDRADVFLLNENLKNVNYTNKSNPSYFSGTSPSSLVFSSKEKAKEFFTYNEYQDFYTVKISSTNTAMIQTITDSKAKGETHIPKVGDVWIRYKKDTFTFDGTYTESDWCYYYYSGTNENQINITTAMQNTLLSTAVSNVADKLTDEGSQTDLYAEDKFIDPITNLPDIPYSNTRKYADFTGTIYSANFSSVINYKDSDISMAVSGGHFTLRLDYNSSIINCPAESYVDLYIGFYVKDGANNSTYNDITYTKYRYDVRELFTCNFQTNSQKVIDDIDDISSYDIDSTFSFSYTVDETNGVVGDLGIEYIEAYDSATKSVRTLDASEYNNFFTINSSKSGTYVNKFEVKAKQAGYFKIEFAISYLGSKKKHDPYEFYMTDEFNDNTKNYTSSKDNRILVNNLYRLSEQYTYMDANRVIHKESYGNTETGNVYFSNIDSLTDYVRYMELQDLQLVTLTGTMAESLASGGIGIYTKADGEKNIPAVGQTWIRYKIPSWTSESIETAWVYYWYDNNTTSTIKTNNFSGILESAISTVVGSIVNKAVQVKLVNGSYLDENGSPCLLEDEYHVSDQKVSITKTNSIFASDNQYSGDDRLFDSTVSVSIDGISTDVPILTNQKLSKADKTHLFYAYYSGQEINTLVYQEFSYTDGQTYRQAINGSNGTYFIREVSISGIHDYVIYLDNLAPTLNIKFTSPNSTVTNSRALNSESNGYQFGCKTFTLSNLNSVSEFDKYSYVIVYDENSKVNQIFYMSDLEANDFTLPNGSWTIVVSDRSGNSYAFKVSCTTVKLTLEVSVDDSNDFVKVGVNREPAEIYRYQVFLDGAETPIDDSWGATSTTYERYKESGFYYIYVQDIYGYILEEKGDAGSGIVFERSVPSVTWSYLDYDNSSYTPYNASSTTMSMYKSLGNVYYISTSRPIKFRMEETYKYSITGLDLDTEVKIPNSKDVLFGDATEFLKNGTLKDFQVEIWYEDYPDISVTYIVICDTESPDILLTYKTTSWDNTDNEEAYNLLNSVDVGYVYTPNNIDYYNSKDVVNVIKTNARINSNLITLDVDDLSGVKNVYVYLTEPGKKEELFMDITPTNGKVENISLSRYGYYRVVAYDVFNNMDEICFTNTTDERVSYSVDGVELDQRSKDVIFGNDNSTIKLLQDGLLSIEVIEGDTKSFYFVNVIDGVAYEQEYRCELVSDGQGNSYRYVSLVNKQMPVMSAGGYYVNQDVELFSIHDPVYNTVNKFYQVLAKYDENGMQINPFTLYMSYDQKSLLTFKVVCDDDDITVKYRVNYEYTFEPYLLEAKLSHRLSDVTIKDSSNNVIDVTNEKLNYTNTTFSFDSTINEDITKIEISYSNVKEFNEYTTIYPYVSENLNDTSVIGQFDTSINGFYSVRISNKYGNTNTYLINRSDVFQVITTANYDDGDYDKLPNDYNKVVKANSQVVIEGYSENVEFRVTKNGQITTSTKGKKLDGYYQLTLADEGSYIVQIIDLVYGNMSQVEAIIKHSKLVVDADILIGYNEKALCKEDGYTNKKLTIVKDKVLNNKVRYIEIIKDDTHEVLYNSINDEDEVLDESKLLDCIGNNGDGIYYVVFKDEYGSKVVKEIHYASNSPFKIYRKITSSQDNQELVLSKENIEFGFWSNDSFIFNTSATTYRFYVNDVKDECPKTVGFATGAGNGTIPYTVYYIDEYGFEFSFSATLDRRSLSIMLDESVNTLKINDIDNTNSPISLTFSDGNCYYTIDGENEKEYKSGEVLYQDGAYRFNCFDKSGNSTSLVVIKDSTCKFNFIVTGTYKSLIDGEAFNGDSVTLEDDDNIVITKYYLDGVKQEVTDERTYRKAGHYYFFLEDGVGNTSIFEFIMISHNLNSFTYQTPNSYIITEMWFSGKDGTFINYLNTGKVFVTDSYSIINNVTEDGDYQVVMTSSVYKKGLSFSFTIDTTSPKVSLSGYDGETKTLEDVKLLGCNEYDMIYVYKDGELINVIEYAYNSDPLVITDGGKYRIVVVNQAGNQTELTFEKIKILNDSGSALVIILCLAAVAGLVIGVVLRNKQKFDE